MLSAEVLCATSVPTSVPGQHVFGQRPTVVHLNSSGGILSKVQGTLQAVPGAVPVSVQDVVFVFLISNAVRGALHMALQKHMKVLSAD